MRNGKVRYMTMVGMLSAYAYVLTLIGKVVPIRFNDFLQYDPKDAVIVISGFALGPLASLFVSVIVAFLELITISSTGVIGFLMNVLSSVSFACIAAFIYKHRKSLGGAVFALTVSSVVTVGAMVLWNYLVTPVYMGVPREVVAGMILPVFLPFNVIKCGLNASLAMLIYKPFVQAMRSVKLLPAPVTDDDLQDKAHFKLSVTIPALAVMAAMVALFIILG